jgi:hypothetical protein
MLVGNSFRTCYSGLETHTDHVLSIHRVRILTISLLVLRNFPFVTVVLLPKLQNHIPVFVNVSNC